MSNYAEAYFSVVERLTGRRESGMSEIGTTVAGLPPVYVLFFEGWPADGILSAMTLGVAMGPHQEDEVGHCELIVSVRSTDRRWGLAAGMLGEESRGKVTLAPGGTLNLGEPISAESSMEAFMLTRPHQWRHLESPVRVSDREVSILEAHPIYSDELTAIRHCSREKLEKALFGAQYDVARPHLVRTA